MPQSFYWLQYKRLLCIVVGVVFLVTAAAVAAPKTSVLGTQKSSSQAATERSRTPADKTTVTSSSSAAPLATEQSPENNSETTMSTGSPVTTPIQKPIQTSESVIANSENRTKNCASLTGPLLKTFEEQVATKKAKLDESIAWPLGGSVGSSLIGNYITDYNQQITDIFKKTQASATKLGCTLPIISPPVLPLDYLPTIL